MPNLTMRASRIVWYLQLSAMVDDSSATLCMCLRLLIYGLGRISGFPASINARLIPATASRNLPCISLDRKLRRLVLFNLLVMLPRLFEGSFDKYLRIDCPPPLGPATSSPRERSIIANSFGCNKYVSTNSTDSPLLQEARAGSPIAFGGAMIFFLEHMFNL